MILDIIICSLFLYGTKVLWQEGMILEQPKKWLDRVFGEALIRKPLYACPPCMASIWGTAVYWVMYPEGEWEAWVMWPVFCIAVSGVTWMLLSLFPFDE